MTTPADEVVRAFGGAGPPIAVGAGSSGTAWRAGPIVLKRRGPSDLEAELWAALADDLGGDGAVRMARPVPAADGRWSFAGWSATTWVEGRSARAGEWREVLEVGDRLHAALAATSVPWPALLDDRADPWAVADRQAWADDADVGQRQIVHGDVAGNVVLLDDERPGVLDLALYHRPAAWARAVAVADLVAWWEAPPSLLDEVGPDLVGRTIVYRTVVATLRGERHDYGRVIDHQRP